MMFNNQLNQMQGLNMNQTTPSMFDGAFNQLKPPPPDPRAGRTLGRPVGMRTPGTGSLRTAGLGGSNPAMRQGPSGRPPPWAQGLRSPHNSPNMDQSGGLEALRLRQSGGVRPGNNMMGGPSVGAPMGQPSLDQIQAQMARRQVGAQLGPRNGALAGYMMG